MTRDKNILLQHNFNPGFSWFSEVLGLDSYPEFKQEAHELYELAVQHLKPLSIHRVEYTNNKTKNDNIYHIQLGSIEFKGKILNQLNSVNRVFPYISTCGDGLENIDSSRYDSLALYWISILKTKALTEAQSELKKYIKNNYKTQRLNSLNPGSGDVDLWGIEEVKKIFNLFKSDEDSIGVHLTESCLMIPDKTLAGILFDSKHTYESCAFCRRQNCPDRRVPSIH